MKVGRMEVEAADLPAFMLSLMRADRPDFMEGADLWRRLRGDTRIMPYCAGRQEPPQLAARLAIAQRIASAVDRVASFRCEATRTIVPADPRPTRERFRARVYR